MRYHNTSHMIQPNIRYRVLMFSVMIIMIINLQKNLELIWMKSPWSQHGNESLSVLRSNLNVRFSWLSKQAWNTGQRVSSCFHNCPNTGHDDVSECVHHLYLYWSQRSLEMFCVVVVLVFLVYLVFLFVYNLDVHSFLSQIKAVSVNEWTTMPRPSYQGRSSGPGR